ncbi:SRPBCC family protein [Halorussus salinisoli]|uniref:SRPBCC family protein n=1 Tax=Halorussus salinisoli TaxID=2558242 RepID=UPI0010C176CB|nr:SRPBCC family protein [Halorussus salinisoli]
MHTVSVSRTIDAPIDDVWSVLDDFGDVANYNPNIKTSGIVDGPDTGIGATRECRFYDGNRIEEQIVEYEPKEGYAVNFLDVGEFPLKTNVVEIDVESVDDSRSTVTMTANFTPKYGPVGWVMGQLVMKSKFEETFDEVLDGLATYVQTGQKVDKGR